MSGGSGQPPPVVGIAQIWRPASTGGRLCRVRLPLPRGGEARGLSRRRLRVSSTGRARSSSLDSCEIRRRTRSLGDAGWFSAPPSSMTATPPPGWMPPSAGERQSARLLRIGLNPSEQAERPLSHRRTGMSAMTRCGVAAPRLLQPGRRGWRRTPALVVGVAASVLAGSR